MKKIIIAAIAVLALCCSCSKDTCKCTVKTESASSESTLKDVKVPKPEGKTCAEVAETMSSKVLGVTTTYTCVAAAAENSEN